MTDDINSNETAFSGVVRWYDSVNGYGFVKSDVSNEDALISQSVIFDFGMIAVATGTLVQCFVVKAERGLRITRILSLQKEEISDNFVFTQYNELEIVPARLKWFNEAKGFGFANRFNDPEDVLVAKKTFSDGGISRIEQGQAFGMAVIRQEKGLLAVKIKPWIFL